MKKRLTLNDFLVPVILGASGWIALKVHENTVSLAELKVTTTSIIAEHNTTQVSQESQQRQIWSLDKRYEDLKAELNKRTKDGKL